eukprot:m.46951 g.46951  ORF g.46951 m.46951 type:complete len:488 (+) comp7300_c0_seq1:158-1621(+)
MEFRPACLLCIVVLAMFSPSSSMMCLGDVSSATASVSILEFGAIPNESSNDACWANSIAITKAIYNVSRSYSTTKTVVIPSGYVFTSFPVQVSNVAGVTLVIDGHLLASKNISAWPLDSNKDCIDFLLFTNITHFTITGSGRVDGQGYDWWWLTIFTVIHNERPHLISFYTSTNVTVEGIELKNSPSFHLRTKDLIGGVFRHLTIKVDVDQQKQLYRDAGLMQSLPHPITKELIEIPTFPLNTDGIDPAGENIHIYNCSIENFDDAVAVKPSHGGDISPCSQNMLIENCTVAFGVGLTIGSVPPNIQTNCVRNITFRNINSHHPIKAIYVKTNPGTVGDGIIENILYENINITYPLWWSIYIGPQQQKQPDGGGPGCMLYPFGGECPTQPRVPIRNITLRNIQSTGGLLSPGVLRCNKTKPCTDIVFDNVHVSGNSWPADNFICENMDITSTNTSPIPVCKRTFISTATKNRNEWREEGVPQSNPFI